MNIAQIGAGTLFFPLLYILNDIITEIYGLSASRRTIWVALYFNIAFSISMYFIMLLPSGNDWQEQEAFELIYAMSPRIILASLSSYLVSELINASILSSLKIHLQGRFFALRAIFSTLIASFLESIMFSLIAFYGRIPNDELIKMIVMTILIKVFYEIALMPLTVILVSQIRKIEKPDNYSEPGLYKISF